MKNNAPVQQVDLSINNGNTVLVDEQLIDIIKEMIQPVDDETMRNHLSEIIANANTIDLVFKMLEAKIYMHKVYRKMNEM